MCRPDGVLAAPRLVCFGNLTLDDIVQPDGTERPSCIGGDALYGVLGARLFEPSAEMVAPVGCDFPPDVRAQIAAAGLSGEGLPVRSCPTMRTRFEYATHDRRTVRILSDEGDFDELSPRPADVPAHYWGAPCFMVLAMTLRAQADIVAACRAAGQGLVALDPQEEYIAGHEAEVLALVARVDVFMPSLDEVRQLLGHENAERAARTFASLGPRIVVIKLGSEGCLVHDAARGHSFRLPAYPVSPIDTTGAGDAYCCAFMASLAQAPGALDRAAAQGAIAASVAVSTYGANGLFSEIPASGRADVAEDKRLSRNC